MNPQHASSSMEMDSQQDNNDEINKVISGLKAQYLQVRRPNEDNILEFLDYEGNKNKQSQQSVKNSSSMHQESPKLNSYLIEDKELPSPLKSVNQSQIKLRSSSEKIKGMTQNQLIDRFINKLKKQSPFKKGDQLKQEQLRLIKDQSSDYPVIKVQENQFNLVKLWNFAYITLQITQLIQSSLRLAFNAKIENQLAILCAVIIPLDWLINLYLTQFELFKLRVLNIRSCLLKIILELPLVIIIIIFMIVGMDDGDSWVQLPIFLELIFMRQKYIQIRQNLKEFSYIIFQIMETFAIFLIYSHFSACIFYYFTHSIDNSWLERTNIQFSRWQLKYQYSLYWSVMTISTIGQSNFGFDNPTEALISIILSCTIFIGFVYFAIDFANNWKANFKLYKNQQILNKYLSNHEIEPKLSQKIQQYLKDLWRQQLDQQIQEELRLVTSLSPQLQQELQLRMYAKQIMSIPFFSQLSSQCLKQIIFQIKEYSILSNQELEQSGLFLCLSGQLNLYLPNGVIQKQINKGDFIGHQYLFYEKLMPYRARTSQLTRIAYLSRQKFIEVIRRFPIDYVIEQINIMETRSLETGHKCYVCNDPSHDFDTCPSIHFVLDQLSVVQKYQFSKDQERQKHQRTNGRTTNARFGQKLFEDAASMFQEMQSEESMIGEQLKTNNNIQISVRKKSKSLNSEEQSKFQKSLSGQSLSAIPKPQGSMISASSFNIFKDNPARKISRQQDSDKISSNSQNNVNKAHKSSSSSGREVPQIPIVVEDKYLEDSVLVAQQRTKKQMIGRLSSQKYSPQLSQNPLQAIPSVSELQSENEDISIMRQFSKHTQQSNKGKHLDNLKMQLIFKIRLMLLDSCMHIFQIITLKLLQKNIKDFKINDYYMIEIIDKLNSPNLNDQDLKDILQQILKTQGSIIGQILQNYDNMHNILTQKMVDVDKPFYSALFTIVKQVSKWQNQRTEILVAGFIPTLLSINILGNDQMVEVLLLTIYSEFLETVNKPREQLFDFENMPEMKQQYGAEFIQTKKTKLYQAITQISPQNLMDIHQMLLDILSRYVNQLGTSVIRQIIRLGFIYCGSKFELSDLKTFLFYNPNFSLFKIQMTERSQELLLIITTQIKMSHKDIRYTDQLLELIRKKSANECKFNVAALAQSIIEVNEDIYDGVF